MTFDTHLARILSPIERLLGVSLLGYTTASKFAGNFHNSNNNTNSGN